MRKIFNVDDFDSMFCDGLAIKDGDLIFGSFWGRDTTILECLSKYQLPTHSGGLSYFNVEGVSAFVKPDTLKKQTSRSVSKTFGNLVHLWLYNESLLKIDSVNHSSISLYFDKVKEFSDLPGDLLWNLINKLCPFPLLASWKEQIVDKCINENFVSIHPGLNLSCIEVNLDADILGEFISTGVKNNQLNVDVAHD